MSSSEDNKTIQQAEQKPISKWKDPAFVKQYYRELHRKRNPPKIHPYIMEDGRKWSEHHEFPPEFESKEAYEAFKKERKKGYAKTPHKTLYIKTPKTHCEICNIDIHAGKWAGHLQSIKHNRNVDLLKKFNVNV